MTLMAHTAASTRKTVMQTLSRMTQEYISVAARGTFVTLTLHTGRLDFNGYLEIEIKVTYTYAVIKR